MTPPSPMLRVILVGPGRLGCSLSKALAGSSKISLVAVAYHSSAGRERAARWMPDVPRYHHDEIEGVDSADLVLLTVRDDVIAGVARVLAPSLTSSQVIAHTSGLLDSGVFAPGIIAAARGTFHPLQSFVNPEEAAKRFNGCFMALEGDSNAVAVGRRLARELGCRDIVLKGNKVAYHAAAVVASNYLVALTSFAVRLCHLAGIDEQTAIEMLRPLQLGALDNLARVGSTQALTGPIARGDLETVRAHVELIDDALPEMRGIYGGLGTLAVELAREQGQGQDQILLDKITELLGFSVDPKA